MSTSARLLDNALFPIMHMLFGMESRLLAARETSSRMLLAELADGLSSLSLRVTPNLLEFPLVGCWSGVEGPESNLRLSTHALRRVNAKEQPPRKGSRTPQQLREYFRTQICHLFHAPGFREGLHPVKFEGFLSDLSIRRYQGLDSYWYYKSQPLGDSGSEIHILAFPKLYPIRESGRIEEIEPRLEQLEKMLLGGLPRLVRLARFEEELDRPGKEQGEVSAGDAKGADGPLSFTGILTDIHVASMRLESANSSGATAPSPGLFDHLRRYFGMLVCRPIILPSSLDQGFQYALTSIQQQKLRNVADAKNWESSLKAELRSVLDCERRQVLQAYGGNEEPDAPLDPATEAGLWPDTEPVARLMREVCAIPEQSRSRQQDRFLRMAATWLYAMSGAADLRHCVADRSWPDRIAEVTIHKTQAELIDQVLDFADSEVIEEPFIAHELSQVHTEDILQATCHLWSMQDAAPNSALYPAFLHLSERLLFPSRFFLYPLFYQGFPVSVFGFDADRFNEDRGKMVEILRDHSGSLLLGALHSEFQKVFRQFIGVLECFVSPNAEPSRMQAFENQLQGAYQDFAFHDMGKESAQYGYLYAQMKDAIRNLERGTENRARYESAVLLLSWLYHELSHVDKAVADVLRCDQLDRGEILKRTSMYIDTIKMVSEIAAPGHETTPMSRFREYGDLLKSSLQPIKLDFALPEVGLSELPYQMLLVMVELVRNASKTATKVDVELRDCGDSTALMVRSSPHTEEDWRKLEIAKERANGVGLHELLGLVRQMPTGVLLVQLLSNSVGGMIDYSAAQIGTEIVIQSICQMPLSSREKNS